MALRATPSMSSDEIKRAIHQLSNNYNRAIYIYGIFKKEGHNSCLVAKFSDDCQPCYILHEYMAGDKLAARQERSKLQNAPLQESTFEKHLGRIQTLISDLKDTLEDREKEGAARPRRAATRDFIDQDPRDSPLSRASQDLEMSFHNMRLSTEASRQPAGGPSQDIDASFDEMLSSSKESRGPMSMEPRRQPPHDLLASDLEHAHNDRVKQTAGRPGHKDRREFVGKPSSDSPNSIPPRDMNAFYYDTMSPKFESREWVSAEPQRQRTRDRPATGLEHASKGQEKPSAGGSRRVSWQELINGPSRDARGSNPGNATSPREPCEPVSTETRRQPMHDRPRERRIVQETSRNPATKRGAATDNITSRIRSIGPTFPTCRSITAARDFELPISISPAKDAATKKSDFRKSEPAVGGSKEWQHMKAAPLKHNPRENRHGWDVIEHAEADDESAQWDLCD
ncbi:MAG: hypothetical protein Q9169_008108 [Polycauliona sp. 2 TL-2023]